MPVKWSVPALVLECVDGDTFHLQLDLGWRIQYTARCRIKGINAPELSTAEGVDAKAYAAALLPVGSAVIFVSHSLDKYGRPLGEIKDANGEDFGEHMLSAGKAAVMKE